MGIGVGSAACRIIDAGEAQHMVEQVISSTKSMKVKKNK